MRIHLGVTYCFPKFPISLSIKLVSPDEYWAAFLSGIEQQEVGWDSLVVMDLDDLADLQVGRGYRCVVTSSIQLPLK